MKKCCDVLGNFLGYDFNFILLMMVQKNYLCKVSLKIVGHPSKFVKGG